MRCFVRIPHRRQRIQFPSIERISIFLVDEEVTAIAAIGLVLLDPVGRAAVAGPGLVAEGVHDGAGGALGARLGTGFGEAHVGCRDVEEIDESLDLGDGFLDSGGTGLLELTLHGLDLSNLFLDGQV